MLAFTLILALTAHSALAKPTGNCIFMCEAQPGFSGTSGALHQGFGQAGSSFGQGGSSFGQGGSSFGQGGSNFGQGMFGRIEDFGTVPVQPVQSAAPVYQPAYQRPSYRPQFSQAQTGLVETVHQQIPVQPAIDGMFVHSSGKSSYESNHGYMKISQPGMTQTVVKEPIIMQQPMRQPIRQNPCENYYDPCQY